MSGGDQNETQRVYIFFLASTAYTVTREMGLFKLGRLVPTYRLKDMAKSLARWMEQRELEGRMRMRIGMVAVLVVIAAYNAQAKDAPAYEKGVLIQMESSSGGYAEKDRKTIAGEIFGTDAQHKNTKVVMCQEYVLQIERIT